MNRRLYTGSVALAAVVLAALGIYLLSHDSDDGGAERAAGPATAASSAVFEPVDARRQISPLRRECEPRRIAATLLEFLDALNHGDRRAARFIAPQPEFNGWSVGERHSGDGVFVKAPNERLFGYLRGRHERGERLGRLAIAVAPAPIGISSGPFSGTHGGAPAAAFDFELSRTASDLRARGIRIQRGGGKAGINCRTGRIFLWAQGWGGIPRALDTCPKTTIEPTWSSALACAPGYRGVNEAVVVPAPAQRPG